LMDYGKYQYQLARQLRLQKAKQKEREIKGIRFTLRTGQHDLDFKLKQTEKFLEAGHKIKLELILKGREKAHLDLAREKLKEFTESLSGDILIEQGPKRHPRGLLAIISKKG
ncbi:MAG TPA: translation initiation factor IF-3, partial [Candidatus Portnoybacteria bacterium]|nr:translation initiation factor IF-3 [Candidatus Portnoybacteria bacterium]